MKALSWEELEAIAGPVVGHIDEKLYKFYCDFIAAVNAEHRANPEISEVDCYRNLFNSIAVRCGFDDRL